MWKYRSTPDYITNETMMSKTVLMATGNASMRRKTTRLRRL